jgi:transposase
MDGPACQGCRERDARIAALEARIAELEEMVRKQGALIADLTRKLQDKDLPKGARPAQSAEVPAPGDKKPTGRKPGGQPGHPPHLKKLLPPERVSKTLRMVPQRCERCDSQLSKDPAPGDPSPVRFQVAELPEIRATITEYQGHARTCACCGHVTRATLAEEIRKHSVGPGLSAFMSYLVGNCGLGKRRVEELVESVFEVPISLGTVIHLEQEMSAALESTHAEALKSARQAPVKHMDETGWKKAGRKRWLWVLATAQVAVFFIHRLRNAAVVEHLLGGPLQGILCTDRWTAYDWVPLLQRQLCWAHLKRNLEKLALEEDRRARKTAETALAIQQRVFELWHLFRGGGLSRKQLDDEIAPRMLVLLEVFQKGGRCRHGKTARFCRRVLKLYPALWAFVAIEGIEPTNNHAERVQRLAVLYRKNCFGCHSNAGCRFVERLLTVVQTLRLQRRPVLRFLTALLQAHRTGKPKPTLALQG